MVKKIIKSPDVNMKKDDDILEQIRPMQGMILVDMTTENFIPAFKTCQISLESFHVCMLGN